MDLVVTRLQVQRKKKLVSSTSEERYEGIVDAFRQIYEEDGISGFYEGAAEDTIATTISAFFYFYAYDFMRSRRLRYVGQRTGKPPSTLGVAEELLIGTLAGMFCKFWTSPLNNIVTRKQVGSMNEKQHSKRTAMDVVNEIWKEKGLTGFWTGYKATILLSINPSLTYYFFQVLRTMVIPRKRRENPTSVELFFLSAFAKTAATLITYPIMMAKTRQQAAKTDSEGKEKSSIIKIASDVLESEGPIGLYQGAKGQILRGFFSQGLTMMTKDQIAKAIIYLYVIFILKPKRSVLLRTIQLIRTG